METILSKEDHFGQKLLNMITLDTLPSKDDHRIHQYKLLAKQATWQVITKKKLKKILIFSFHYPLS